MKQKAENQKEIKGCIWKLSAENKAAVIMLDEIEFKGEECIGYYWIKLK